MRVSCQVLVAFCSAVLLASSRSPAGERWYVLDQNNSDHVCLVNVNVNGANFQSPINEWFSLVGQVTDLSGYKKRYCTLLFFDNSRMPVAEKATLWLASPAISGYSQVGSNLWRVSINWGPNTDWTTTSLRGKKISYLYPPAANSWKGINITDLYNSWRNGTEINRGLALTTTVNYTNITAYTMPTAEEALRPRLVVQYDSNSHFRFPLDGGWQNSRVSGYRFGDLWLPDEERCFDGWPFKHTGVDWHAEAYDSVYSVVGGVVKWAKSDSKWGGYVSIEHNTNKIFVSTYTHVIPIVKEGARVEKGDTIAYISPGNANFDPHLHFQIRGGVYENSISRKGRLPEVSCFSETSPTELEPQFPENFFNPELLKWD